MPKTIKPGIAAKDRIYRVECKSCKGIFEFAAHEGHETHDQRDGSMIMFYCPTKNCGISLYGYPDSKRTLNEEKVPSSPMDIFGTI
jgi:hypothetical protein